MDLRTVEPDLDQPCGCPVTLLVVHPDERVRGRVLGAAPPWLRPLAVARPEQLQARLARARRPLGTLVVALDPARTSATAVRALLPEDADVHLLSVSDLQLDAPDPAVDSTLPRRRLTRTTLLRHLRTVGAVDPGCATTARERLVVLGGPS